MATIKDIARAVGVSSAAVSRVLNYDEGISVSKETREAIFAAADKLGYKKKIIYPRIDNVALLYWVEPGEELEDVYYHAYRDELLRQAEAMNIRLRVITKAEGIGAIPGDLNAFLAMGWFSRRELDLIVEKCPIGVFIDSSPDEKLFDSVRPNLDSFVTQIVDFFVRCGHEKLGFIGGSDRNTDTGKPSMDIREWSFRQSARYYGMLEEKYIMVSANYTVSEGYRMAAELIRRGDLPTAICVASDTLAVGVLQALNEANIQIPEQVSVFSINDISIAQYVSPPLTTFHVNVPIICEAALELLRGRVFSQSPITRAIFINGVPTMRKSCKQESRKVTAK